MIKIRMPDGRVFSSEEDGLVEINENVGPDIMEMQDNAMDDNPETGEYDSTEYADDPEDITDEIEDPNPHGTAESYRITLPNGISIESDGGESDNSQEEDPVVEGDELPEEDNKEEEPEVKSGESFRINFPNGQSIESTPYGIMQVEPNREYSSEADAILDDFFKNYS